MTGATSYALLSPKQKRIVERDVDTLFTPSAFLPKLTIDDIKRLGAFHPTVEYRGKTLFLSDTGIAALRRLTDVCCRMPALTHVVSRREVGHEVQSSYSSWLERTLQPTGQEFVEAVADALLASVKDYELLAKVEGLDLKDQDFLQLGSVRIQRANRALLEGIRLGGGLDAEAIFEQFKDSLWLLAKIRGSADVATEQFRYRATLAIGMLATWGAVTCRGAIWRSGVRAVLSASDLCGAVSTLKWEVGSANPSLSRTWRQEQDLPLPSESVDYLAKECFLHELAALPERDHRSELHDAILRAVYWFADAYRDRNPTMQFVKLWSCAECFFAIDRQQVTELNAKGIASVLAFAGYGIIPPAEYPRFKRRVKALYALRSKAIHGAAFGHIELADLEDFSRWIAWIIISMVSLSERGYQTLKQIHEQTSRLDNLSDAKAVAPDYMI